MKLAREDPRATKLAAKVWKTVATSAYTGPGVWAWLAWPPEGNHYRNPRSLWLTWMPGKRYQDGFELLLHSTLQSVDSCHDVLRRRALGLARVRYRAEPGASYGESYTKPLVIYQEMMIAIVLFNFSRPYKGRAKFEGVPAEAMGVAPMGKQEGKPVSKLLNIAEVPYFFKVAWTFRLGFQHVERMTKWLHR